MPMAAGSGSSRAPPQQGGCQAARVLKEQGNEALRVRRFNDAVELYTQALQAERSAVVLANRAEAYLRLGKAEEALTDADAAVATDPEYAKGYWRRGAALSALGRHAEAVTAYAAGLGRKGADAASFRQKLDEESAAAWPVEAKRFTDIGRSLVATCGMRPGDDVLCEEPAVVWDAGAPPDAEVAAIFAKHGLSADNAAGRIWQAVRKGLTQYQLDCIRDLSVPEFDILGGGAVVPWINAARDIAEQLPQLFGSNHYYVARLLLAIKTNAHHIVASAEEHAQGGIFRLGSKLAHSCAPNCIYHLRDGRVRFSAARHIAAGEVVSFSYRGELDWLEMSARRRQRELQRVMLFHCACQRCQAGDELRAFRCDCSDRGARWWHGPYPAPGEEAVSQSGWRCDECSRDFSDAAMSGSLASEQRLEELCDSLAVAPATAETTVVLTAALADAEAALGPRHWEYARLCRHAAKHFAKIARNTRDDLSAQVSLAFSAHLLRWQGASGLWRHSPTLAPHTAAVAATRAGGTCKGDCTAYPGSGPPMGKAIESLLRYSCPRLAAVYKEPRAPAEATARALEEAKSRGVVLPSDTAAAAPADPSDVLPVPPPPSELFAAWAQGAQR